MRISLIVVLLTVWGQVLSQDPKKPKPLILFSIRETPVYTDEFAYLYKKNHVKPEEFSEPRINEYLDLFINFKLKVREARSRGIDTTLAFTKEFKTYKEELKRPYLAEKDVVDRLTEEAYQHLTEEIKAAHILITIKPDASPADTVLAWNKIQKIRQSIQSGYDFEKAAREFSEDPSAASNGGNLGYFTTLQMVYPFEQAAYQLKVGEVSAPVRTRFGYHLIKLLDRKPARGEIEVSHIILRTNTANDKKVKNKIFEIYDQLQAGRSWAELCKEYSEDQATKDSGGKLRPFGVGALSSVPEFEAVAFSLKNPGDFSDPFMSTYGWHIIKLERKIPLPSYKELESSLKRKVARDDRVQMANSKQLNQKKQRYGFSEDITIKNQVFSSADSALTKGKWKYNGDTTLLSKSLFHFGKQTYRAGQFIHFAEKNQQATNASPVSCINQLYDQFTEEKVEALEDARLMEENPEYRNLLNEYKEGILLFTIMESEVWNKGTDDSVGLKKFYSLNKEKYMAKERVHARLLATTDKTFFDEANRKIAAGDSLSKNDTKKFKSILPFRNYEKGENKAVDNVPWAIGIHRLELETTFYIVEIDNLLPPGPKTFEEAHAKVVSDHQEELEKKWIKELKQKYPVKINNKGKKFVTQELVKK